MVAQLPTRAEITAALDEAAIEWRAHRHQPAHSYCDASCKAQHMAWIDELLDELNAARRYADA